MFESAEIGHRIEPEVYRTEVPKLREALLDAQFELDRTKDFSVVILIAGEEASGKGFLVNTLLEWLDPRLVETFAMDVPTDEERERPRMWRFWRALPPRGRIGIFFGSWYTAPILKTLSGDFDRADLDQGLSEARRFETMLANEDTLVLKFYLHITKKEQKRRLKRLEKDPLMSWRLKPTDWERHKQYDEHLAIVRHMIRVTDEAHAPWFVVEATDDHYAYLTVGQTIEHNMRTHLAEPDPEVKRNTPTAAPPLDHRHLIDQVDLGQKVGRKKYERRKAELQGELAHLTRSKKFRKHAAVAVFEGVDAAGKGGAIRRATAALDARYYTVVPISAPSDEERLHPYLWRFWRHIPRLGRTTIFDRSWYGRVLVERVEGFADEADWLRAYGEINDFEEALVRHGIVVTKFWLTISQEEQLERFKAREATGYKRHKITDEDWRNREKWDAYAHAMEDMIERTSTGMAPWTIVEAEDKKFARLKVLETLCTRIEVAL